jgi:2-polyprenyl-3-methyl-5-hydroxy-6-metoxy-1,4-benzoquinol methylase
VISNNRHYRQMLVKQGKTTFASCGFEDRFDPFTLNKNEKVRRLYGTLFEHFLPDISCNKILDLGCGTGIYFDLLMKYADEIEALDISRDMICVAREYCSRNNLHNIHPKTGSAESLDYEDGLFDTVIALDLLHHVARVDKVVDEVHRVLKQGGHFLVFEPNICNPLMFLAHAIPREERLALRRNRPSTLVALLESKFESVRWQGVCGIITQWTGIKNIILATYLHLNRMVGLKKLYPRQAWLGTKQ